MTDRDQEAAASLAEIDRLRGLAADRLGLPRRLYWVLAAVMGAAVAALTFRSVVVVGVATVACLAVLLLLFGTPAGNGVVPRETSRSRTQVVVGSLALLGVFTVGLVGQQAPMWWLPLVAAPLAAATTLGVGQWRVAEMRRATSASTTGEFRNE